jgi:hypothetical protein
MNSDEIVDNFYSHFITTFKSDYEIKNFEIDPLTDTLFDHSLIFMTENKICEILKKQPLTCNITPDGIPSFVLNKCATTLAVPLGHIFRTSFFNKQNSKNS